MSNVSSVSPHYLNDSTSFKETLEKLTEAKSLSVNTQGNLTPTGLFNNAFKAGTISNPRLVELKIMEFLIQGKKWLKPDDLQLLDKLAGKVGLIEKKDNHTHKELHLLINLIAKEILQKEVILQKDYLDLCQAFQTHYRRILAAFPNHCEQVNTFAGSFKLQNDNTPAVEQEEPIDTPADFVIPENNQKDNSTLPTPIGRKVRTLPLTRLDRKNLSAYEKNKRLASQIALGTMGTIATGSALYHSCKFINSIKFNYFHTDIPKIAPQVSYIGLGIVSLGISTMILGTAYFYKTEKNRNQANQKNNQNPDPNHHKIEPEREKASHSDNEDPINLDFMNNDKYDTFLSPIPNSYQAENINSIKRRKSATNALREKIKEKKNVNPLNNNSSLSPTNKIKVMKNAIILTPTKDGKWIKEDLLESINKIREEYIEHYNQSSIKGEGILEFIENIQQIVAGSLLVLNSPLKPSLEAKKTYRYALSALKMLVNLLRSHQKNLSGETNFEKVPLQDSTSYLDFFDYEYNINTQIKNLRLLMDYLSLMASLDPFKNASEKDINDKYMHAKQEIIKLMNTLSPLEPTVVKSLIEKKFTLEELYALKNRHMKHVTIDTQLDSEQAFTYEAWSVVFDKCENFADDIDERIGVLENLSNVADKYNFNADEMDAIYEEFKNFTFDTMEDADSTPTLNFEKNTGLDFDNDNEAGSNEELSSEEYIEGDIISEYIENTQLQFIYNGNIVTFKGDICIEYQK